MKFPVVVLCLLVASCAALPARPARSSVLDLLRQLDDSIEDNGKALIGKLLNLTHYVEKGVLQVKDLVPKVYEKVHQEVDEVLAGLKKVTEEVEELLGRRKAAFGFDLLSGLTELSGGTKLSTVLNLLSLADKAHKVMNDAKEFNPHLQSTLSKIQDKIAEHVRDFANHIVRELGLSGNAERRSLSSKIENLLDRVEEEVHLLILDLLHKMEQTFHILETELPEEYEKVKTAVEDVKKRIADLVEEIEGKLAMRSFDLLDIAGNVSDGTSLGTAFKVMSLLNKFNTVVQDVRNFGPKAEVVLQHSVKRVADSAQVFFTHVSDKLFQD